MEYLDIYDGNGKLTGKTIARGDKNLKENEFFKLTVVWIKCGNKFLIQKTSKEKGGEYAVSGGHVPTGFTSLQQARIEMEEELGLKIEEKNLKFLGTLKQKIAMFDVYLYEDDTLKNFNFVLQEEEVESLQWMTKAEIQTLIDRGVLRKSTEKQFSAFIKTM